MTDLGIFAASSGSPRRSSTPLRNKGNSRFSLTGRRAVALATSGDRKFAGHKLGSPFSPFGGGDLKRHFAFTESLQHPYHNR
jgi:hypothetical protein